MPASAFDLRESCTDPCPSNPCSNVVNSIPPVSPWCFSSVCLNTGPRANEVVHVPVCVVPQEECLGLQHPSVSLRHNSHCFSQPEVMWTPPLSGGVAAGWGAGGGSSTAVLPNSYSPHWFGTCPFHVSAPPTNFIVVSPLYP